MERRGFFMIFLYVCFEFVYVDLNNLLYFVFIAKLQRYMRIQ